MEKVEFVDPLLMQLEEGKKIQETMNQQLIEEDKICEKREGEILLLRKDLENAKTQVNFNQKFSKVKKINEILEAQHISRDQTSLGFDA